ncbi:hypothetical protein Tco_1380622, partial [Tanacetum coccineum]
MSRLEEEVHGLRESLVEQRKVMDAMVKDFYRFNVWAARGKDKKGVGFDEYRAVPPPLAQVYSSPMPDLSWTGLPEFADNIVIDYTRPTPSVDVTNDVRNQESGCPNVIKINNIENVRKPTAKYVELYRNITQSSNVRTTNRDQPRGNQRNWNNLKSQELGKDFVMQNKACYKCGSFKHLK